jgi:PAS domain S-box-containing protein
MRLRIAELEASQAESAEAAQRRLYQHLVEHSLGLMCTHDLDGVLLSVNPAAAESLGYRAGQGVGRNIREFLAPEVHPRFDEYLERIRRNSGDSGYMKLRSRAGAERIWFYRNLKYQEQGRPAIVIGHALDVTDRIGAEKALRESEDRFRSLFENAPIAYHEMDRDGILRRVNRMECEILGWGPEEMIGRNVADFVVPDERGKCCAEIAAEGLAPAESRRFVQRFVCKNGMVRTLQVHENAICSSSGAVAGIRWALLDITERLASEEYVRKLNADLEERVASRTSEYLRSNDELRQFAYIVSHDLQAPLRQVGSIIRLLAGRYEDALDKSAKAWVEHASSRVEHMSALIDDLLCYSLIVNAGAPPLQTVDTSAALAGSMLNLRLSLEESGAQVTEGNLPTVLGDSLGMVQVFQNLLSNAIKYCGGGAPEIHVGAEQLPDEWVFSVRDNGIGIAPQDRERIFAVFKRLHGNEYPGTGIGLAICQKIIERNGGRIWVESESGKGSTFYFTVPR